MPTTCPTCVTRSLLSQPASVFCRNVFHDLVSAGLQVKNAPLWSARSYHLLLRPEFHWAALFVYAALLNLPWHPGSKSRGRESVPMRTV